MFCFATASAPEKVKRSFNGPTKASHQGAIVSYSPSPTPIPSAATKAPLARSTANSKVIPPITAATYERQEAPSTLAVEGGGGTAGSFGGLAGFDGLDCFGSLGGLLAF